MEAPGASSVASVLIDPALPGLQTASDPVTMRDVFRKHLRPVEGAAFRIEECVLSSIRYRPGRACTVQYTVRLSDAATGSSRSQWVTGTLYEGDRAERTWRKLRVVGAGPPADDAGSLVEPISFIPELRMLIQVFPCDRRLPGLPRLLSGPWPGLAPLFLAGFGPGRWQVATCAVESSRYRSEFSAVLGYLVRVRDAATGKEEERRFYVKVFRDDGGQREYETLRFLWSQASDHRAAFTVARPLGYLDELHALVLEEARGTSLQEILLHKGASPASVRRAARALAAFHQDVVPLPRHHSVVDRLAEVRKVAHLLQWACPDAGDEVENIADAVAADLAEVSPGPTHRDLKPDHIRLDRGRVVLLDFAACASADPVLDPALLLARIAAMPIRFSIPRDRARAAARAFAKEYFAHVPGSWRARLPVQYAGAILEVAAGFFRRQEPSWREKIAVVLEEARAALTGRIGSLISLACVWSWAPELL